MSLPEWALAQTVDPVADPGQYQQLLLRLVDGRDPAEVQAEQPDQLARLLAEAGPHLRTRPAPGEWSVLQCAQHILDAEIVMAARYRWVLAHDRPQLAGYDQDLWVGLHHENEDPAELVELFRVLRRSTLQLWARTTPEDRARVGLHAERGPESLELLFGMLAGHGILHMAQAERALAAAQQSSGS